MGVANTKLLISFLPRSAASSLMTSSRSPRVGACRSFWLGAAARPRASCYRRTAHRLQQQLQACRAAGLPFRLAFAGRLRSAGRAAPTCRGRAAVITATFLQPMMRTRAQVKEVVRVHAELIPYSRQPRTAAHARQGTSSRRARLAMRRRSHASGPFAPMLRLRRDRSSLPMRSLPWPARAVSNRGRSSWPVSRNATSERSATRCATATSRARSSSSHWHTSGSASTIRCSRFGQRAAHIAAKNEALLTVADRCRRRREHEERVGERSLHRARQRGRVHSSIPSGARCHTDAERGGAARLVRRAAEARERRCRARSRARRRRPAAAPRGEDRRNCRLPA